VTESKAPTLHGTDAYQLTPCSYHKKAQILLISFHTPIPFQSSYTLCLLKSSLALPTLVVVKHEEDIQTEGLEEATTILSILRLLPPIEDLIIAITVLKRKTLILLLFQTIESLLNGNLQQPSLQHQPNPRRLLAPTLIISLLQHPNPRLLPMFVGYVLNLSSIIRYRNVTIEPAMSVRLGLELCIKRQTVRFAR
jgi:hypothetical protein